jgi:glutaredoxin 3
MSVKQFVESAIASNQVIIFSKTYCSYCRHAKSVLQSKKIPFQAIELDNRPDGSDIQDYLEEKTGQRTVPNIFVQLKHIGGSSDLDLAAKDGTLKNLLQ